MTALIKPSVIAISILTIISLLPQRASESKRQSIRSSSGKATKKIQAAVLLDVSNSMDGLIEQAKAQLWNMVSVMGKAKCGTCHFAPLFNGLLPPVYNTTEFEVLGTPANALRLQDAIQVARDLAFRSGYESGARMGVLVRLGIINIFVAKSICHCSDRFFLTR